jgi:hypothetical protein
MNWMPTCPDAFSTCVPVVSLCLIQDLPNFIFMADTMDVIKTHLQPLVIADGSAEHWQANLELLCMYGLINSGEQALLLADVEALKAKEVQFLPLTYFELKQNLGMFNLLGTVLGSTHILTTTYRLFWTLLFHGFQTEVKKLLSWKFMLSLLLYYGVYNWYVITGSHSGELPNTTQAGLRCGK